MTLLLRTPLVLDAATRNAVAATQIADHPPGTPVVIITRTGVARAYHTTTVEALAERLKKLPKTDRIADSLYGGQAAATMQLGKLKRADLSTFNGVVLDGYQVYAVVGEPGRAAPVGQRGGSAHRGPAPGGASQPIGGRDAGIPSAPITAERPAPVAVTEPPPSYAPPPAPARATRPHTPGTAPSRGAAPSPPLPEPSGAEPPQDTAAAAPSRI